jgi:hypothetical protein
MVCRVLCVLEDSAIPLFPYLLPKREKDAKPDSLLLLGT